MSQRQDFESDVPPNPVHELESYRYAGRLIKGSLQGEAYLKDPAWLVLLERWNAIHPQLIGFVAESGGVIVKNNKNPEWFQQKISSPGAVLIVEKKKFVYPKPDGRENVFLQDQALDLEVLVGRQLFDIRRALSRPVLIPPEFALVRGLATANTAGFTADLGSLTPGAIIHRYRSHVVLDLTIDLIEWIKSFDMTNVPRPDQYVKFIHLQKFRPKASGCSKSSTDKTSSEGSSGKSFDGWSCGVCDSKEFDCVHWDGDWESGDFIQCLSCGASWDVTREGGVTAYRVRGDS